MRNYLLLIVLLCIYACKTKSVENSYSKPITESKNICIIYSFIPSDVNSSTKLNLEEKKYLENVYSEASNIELELICDKEKSVFKLLDKVELDNDHNYKLNSLIASKGKIYYTKLSTNKVYTKSQLNSNPFFVEEENSKDKWQLTDEEKKIDSYTCYKAFYKRLITTREGKQRYVEVIAWYAPEIPYSFGPCELNGLPGLILEASLSDGKSFYVVKNIEFNTIKELNFINPKETKTRDEYNEEFRNAVRDN